MTSATRNSLPSSLAQYGPDLRIHQEEVVGGTLRRRAVGAEDVVRRVAPHETVSARTSTHSRPATVASRPVFLFTVVPSQKVSENTDSEGSSMKEDRMFRPSCSSMRGF